MCLLSVAKNHRNPIAGPIIAWKIVEVKSGKSFTPFMGFRITKKWKSASAFNIFPTPWDPRKTR
jgi:hypothetical protein